MELTFTKKKTNGVNDGTSPPNGILHYCILRRKQFTCHVVNGLEKSPAVTLRRKQSTCHVVNGL